MKKIIGVLLLSILMLTTISIAAYPEELEETENYDGLIELQLDEPIPEANMIEDDVYQIEQEVTIDKIIDGNVYVMAQNLKISGATIYGNIYAMAENIQIENSEIRGSVYVMGSNIRVSGSMDDLYAIGNTITIEEDSTIWRSAKVGANQLEVKGSIQRNLDAFIENLNITDNAIIDGKLSYFAKQQGTISQMAQIGDTEFVQAEEEIEYEKSAIDYLGEAVNVAFKTLIIALIIVFFVSKFKNLPRENTAADLLKSMCKGIGVLVLVPIVSVLLMVSMIGTGLGVVLIAIYSILLYIATAIIAVEIAYKILSKNHESKNRNAKLIGIAILISVVVWAIGLIPVIGGMLKFILILMGLGILWDICFKKVKNVGEINED